MNYEMYLHKWKQKPVCTPLWFYKPALLTARIEKLNSCIKNAIQPPLYGNKYSTRNQLCTEQKTNVLQKDVSKGFTVYKEHLYDPQILCSPCTNANLTNLNMVVWMHANERAKVIQSAPRRNWATKVWPGYCCWCGRLMGGIRVVNTCRRGN